MIGSILTAVVVAYSALIGVLFLAQRSLMYQPSQDLGLPLSAGLPEMMPLAIKTSDGLELSSWYAPPKNNNQVIIYFQGNAGHIGDRGFKVRSYIDAGYGVLLVGYRGYGGNPGAPSEDGLYFDALANLQHLFAQEIPPARWVLYGESLGTGVAVEMAHRFAKDGTPVNAVILEAPFTSMADAAADHYPYVPARALVRDKFDSLSKIDAINTALLVFHGDRDRVVAFTQGKTLFEAARAPKTFHHFDGAHHNDLYDFGAAEVVLGFLRS
jgi:uncharacterized protein